MNLDFKNDVMNRKELIQRLMNVAENYKEGYLYQTGVVADIVVLVDEYFIQNLRDLADELEEQNNKLNNQI